MIPIKRLIRSWVINKDEPMSLISTGEVLESRIHVFHESNSVTYNNKNGMYIQEYSPTIS